MCYVRIHVHLQYINIDFEWVFCHFCNDVAIEDNLPCGKQCLGLLRMEPLAHGIFFYRHYLDILKFHLMDFIKALEQGSLNIARLNYAVITLIPNFLYIYELNSSGITHAIWFPKHQSRQALGAFTVV